MNKFIKSTAIAALLGLGATALPMDNAEAFWGWGGPFNGNGWGNGSFNMNFSGRGQGNGYGNGYGHPGQWGGAPYGYAPYGGAYPTTAPVAPFGYAPYGYGPQAQVAPTAPQAKKAN